MSNELVVKSSISDDYKVFFNKNLDSAIQDIGIDDRIIYIIDEHVFNLHVSGKYNNLLKNNYILVESSESTKTLEYVSLVIEKLISLNFKRDNKLVAIGGGVVQDITAFIASILFRGVSWFYIPTTLLGQCDSCIGSKSSINFKGFKNILGTFKPPLKIYICPLFLETLPEVEIRSGIGEMFHYFLTVGCKDAKLLSESFNDIVINRELLIPFIYKSLNIKKKVIEIDEFDTDYRHIFNYGHTFGHAIETISNYDICHGQAVTLGIDIANYISYKNGLITSKMFDEMHEIILFNIPQFELNPINIDEYINILRKDKKNIDNKLGCILPIEIGKVKKIYVEFNDQLTKIILEYFSK